jgi:hypothetical protein
MRDGAAQESDGRGRFLVLENLDVGQAGGVVDRDVDVLSADLFAPDAISVGAAACGHSLARPGLTHYRTPARQLTPSRGEEFR